MPITDRMPLGELNNYLPADIKAINIALADAYGKDILGRPNFRIAHSDLLVEKRKGTINEFAGSIFVRSYFGVQDVPKYNYFKGFVLEQLSYFHNEELIDSSGGHYEPKWTDWGPDGRPNLKAAKLVVRSILFGVSKNKSDYLDEEEKEDAAARDAFRAEIENVSQAGSGEVIGYTGKEM
jgi:hypothetical protein